MPGNWISFSFSYEGSCAEESFSFFVFRFADPGLLTIMLWWLETNQPLPWKTLMIQQLFISLPVVIIVAQKDFWGYRIRKTSSDCRPYWSCCCMSSHGVWWCRPEPPLPAHERGRKPFVGGIICLCSLKVFILPKFLICVYLFPLIDLRHKYKKNCFSVIATAGQWLVWKL